MKYRFVTDQWTATEWQSLASSFSGMNIYQTWHYAALHSRGPFRSVSRAALFANGCIQVMAQLRIKTIPLCNIGVAEIEWGPLWHSDNPTQSEPALRAFLEGLRTKYFGKRKLEIRLVPRSTMSADGDIRLIQILEDHGFHRNGNIRQYLTCILDLSCSLDTLRKNFHRKWRNHLNKSEKYGLLVDFGNSLEHFDRFYSIYKKMWAKKRFPTGVRVPIIRQLQKCLPRSERFLITLVRDGQEDVGATVCAPIGDTMLYFLGATAPSIRRDCQPGYLLQWLNIQRAKNTGFRWYDTGGFNDETQKDIAEFKRRMNGLELVYPGQFIVIPGQSQSRLYMLTELLYRKTRRLFIGR